MSRAVIRLVDLDAPLGEVELPGGKVVAVRAIDGIAMQMREQLVASEAPMLAWQIAERCLPEATRDEVYGLSVTQVRAVIQMAAGMADAVLDEVGKGTGVPATPAADAPPTS